MLFKKKGLEPLKTGFEKMDPDGEWWKEMKPLRENREINQREDRRRRMCECACVLACAGGGRQTLGMEVWKETIIYWMRYI